MVYSIKDEKECNKSTEFNGVCEVCDEFGFCYKLPLGDYCLLNSPELDNYVDCTYYNGDVSTPVSWNFQLSKCIYPSYSKVECGCGSSNSSYRCERGFFLFI